MGMIALFTDFGWEGPYIGQMSAAIWAQNPDARIVQLMHDAPRFRPDLAAYLLAAAAAKLPEGCVVCAVVDPGVGGTRRALALRTKRRWLVGPDNGLLAPLARAEGLLETHALAIPEDASATFHGRDVFAPAAALLAAGRRPAMQPDAPPAGMQDMPDELARVIYIDGFGNCITGLRPRKGLSITIGGQRLRWARTYADVAPGEPFAYCGSLGLVEIAVREGHAAHVLGLTLGESVRIRQRTQAGG